MKKFIVLLFLFSSLLSEAQTTMPLSSGDGNEKVAELQKAISENLYTNDAVIPSLLNQMLWIYQQQYTTQSPEYADCLMWSAMICAKAGDGVQAAKLLKKSRRLFRKVGTGPFHGKDTIHEIFDLDIRSIIDYNAERDYMSAVCMRKSCDLKKEYFGKESEPYLKAVLDLSEQYAKRFASKRSRYYHNIGYKSYVEIIKREFCEKSESERAMYWSTAVKYINKTLDVALRTRSRAGGVNSMPAAAYDALLLSKGLLLNTTRSFEDYIVESGVEEAIRNLQIKKELTAQNADQRLLDSLDYVILGELKEAGLAYNIPHLSIHWQQVQQQLGDDDLAVEFFRNTTDEYGAVLLKKGWKTPEIVSLKTYITYNGKAVSLQRALQTSPFENYSQKNAENLWHLSKAVWSDDILRYFPVSDTGMVFFAADGEMLVTGVEYLPFLSPKTSPGPTSPYYCISDVYKMSRLSSTRELVVRHSEWSNPEAVIYGGLNYDMYTEDMLADARRYANKGSEQLAFHQGSKERSVRGAVNGIEYLPGTRVEADSIVSTIRQAQHTELVPELFAGDKGTEASFKDLSGQRKKVLHIATHGYFYNMSDSSFNSFGLGDNPLVRSGLFFAGANNKWYDDPALEGADDGFLTSLEIASLDFRGVDMVVMSACETGKGNISGDGVFGLQRGFKMAGVNSILMSLWKVDDNATCLLMTEFYKNWMSGMGKNEALNAAKNAVRSHTEKGWDSPKYWAAFILLDGLD